MKLISDQRRRASSTYIVEQNAWPKDTPSVQTRIFCSLDQSTQSFIRLKREFFLLLTQNNS